MTPNEILNDCLTAANKNLLKSFLSDNYSGRAYDEGFVEGFVAKHKLPCNSTTAFSTVKNLIGEDTLPLYSHNAADKQTGSIGDIEIKLKNDDKVVSCYEIKDKRVTINDINHALKKASVLGEKIDNYIFITTDVIELDVAEYAKTIYELSVVEIAILDCLGFARHFLHFFHRHRIAFINKYQELVLNEPNSSVGQPLKEAFLILRKQAESN